MYQNFLNTPYTGVNPYQSGNPYLDRLNAMQGQQMAQTATQAPRCEIVHVNGENGARAFRMAPKSQCLLLDDTAPIVWLCVSDGAGYHTTTPYQITPYQAQPEPDYNALNQRLTRLEEMLNEQSHVTNAEPQCKPSDATSK